MIYALVLIGIAATLYQLLALLASLNHLAGSDCPETALPPVSILKPVSGLDPGFANAIESHASQNYPEFEILFGTADPAEPSLAVIDNCKAAHPNRPISVIHSTSAMPNAKAGILEDLSQHASHSLLLVNDSDISVPPGYLKRVVAPLSDPHVGLVTCLYRAEGQSWASRWEALGIATDFAPSVLVAPLLGVREFGLGSTLVFRAADLKRIGGFQSIGDFLADDYQLAKRITGLALRAVISKAVVTTHLGNDSWKEVWNHQVRWARTIRACRGIAYLGLPLTHATLWAVLCALNGFAGLGGLLFGVRMAAGMTAGIAVLRSGAAARGFFLIPLWDVWAFAVWLAALLQNSVVWRGERIQIDRKGRILRETETRASASGE